MVARPGAESEIFTLLKVGLIGVVMMGVEFLFVSILLTPGVWMFEGTLVANDILLC